MVFCSANQIDASNWAIAVDIRNENEQALVPKKPAVAIHYVVDNSSSMGSMSHHVRDIFSEMVDTVATSPCSMTVFHESAQILSSDITTGQQMRDLTLPRQGMTNIPAGIEKALRVIYGQEMKSRQRAKMNGNIARIHHVMILLSDGEHNKGPPPNEAFLKFGNVLPNDTLLSVVVVGYSHHSNTSMGMLLKKSIETIAFETDSVQTIYFAKSRSVLQSALANLQSGLNCALKGSSHEIESKGKTLVDNFRDGTQTKVRVHIAPEMTIFFLLHCSKDPPETLFVDGQEIAVTIRKEEEGDISILHLSRLIQNLIDKTKVQVVAAKHGVKVAKECAPKLAALVKALEARNIAKNDLQFVGVSPKERIQQYRIIRDLCNEARVLRNQVLDIANFSEEGSEKTADFLNGRQMKYASKALRRAARLNDGIVDVKAERKAIYKKLSCSEFRDRLRSAMYMDVLDNLSRLSRDQFHFVLLPIIQRSNNAHIILLKEIQQKLKHAIPYDATIVKEFTSPAKELVISGKLSGYLNVAMHGDRKSFFTLSSPWEHLAEWGEFDKQEFDSIWEMLMFAGSTGYPITVERSSASQMNPYLLSVKEIRASLADTASLCCAHRSEIPVYGPEGGSPVQDILVLIDPSMPRSSKMICGSKLLGEKYTSAMVSRDLEMYSGFNMRVALHSNALFSLFACRNIGQDKSDIVANLRRMYMGRAFMCSSCGFGPIDHFACSDLMAHHGQRVGGAAVVNNACPRCGWFSSSLHHWSTWDGNVCNEFILSKLKSSPKAVEYGLSEVTIDLILRILYSFDKMSSEVVKDEYSKLATMMTKDDYLDLSARSGILGMSQILIAILYPSVGNENEIISALNSESCLVSVIQEECVRSARQRFRTKSGGDKETARMHATEWITEVLGIEATSAPFTRPQMQSEPSIENVRQDCHDWYEVNSELAVAEMKHVQGVVTQWCRAWSFARNFRETVASREGGWQKIMSDMETGLSSYQDVVNTLKIAKIDTPQELLGMNHKEMQSIFLGIGVSGILAGVLDKSCQVESYLQHEAILHEAAREMRMMIYMDRVREKMIEWKLTGETEVYYEAMAADIAQFHGMVSMRSHVHGFDKPTFWGLWNAAKNSKDAEKISLFLETAAESFHHKYFDEFAKFM